jgi:hypothetical protein
MKDEIVKVIIPSMGRPETVMTKQVIANASICVPDSQVADYEKYNPECEIIGHPDSVKGLMAKRQWIYDNYPNVFMVDDDMVQVKRNFESPASPEHQEDDELSPFQVYELVQVLAHTAKEMGAYLFGYGVIKNPLHFSPQKPFKLVGNIPGWTVGMLEGSKLKFPDVQLWIEDDYISLLNQYYHRYMLIDQRYTFMEKQQKTGGIVGDRDPEKVEAGLNYLRAKFGRKKVDSMWGGRKKNGR